MFQTEGCTGKMSVEFWWNENDKGKQKNSIVTAKCTGLGLNPVLRGGRPATNHLSHGTTTEAFSCF